MIFFAESHAFSARVFLKDIFSPVRFMERHKCQKVDLQHPSHLFSICGGFSADEPRVYKYVWKWFGITGAWQVYRTPAAVSGAVPSVWECVRLGVLCHSLVNVIVWLVSWGLCWDQTPLLTLISQHENIIDNHVCTYLMNFIKYQSRISVSLTLVLFSFVSAVMLV